MDQRAQRLDAWTAADLDALPVGLGRMDAGGTLLTGNHQLAVLLGVAPDALVGLDLTTLAWPAPDGQDDGPGAVHRLLAGESVDVIGPMGTLSSLEFRVRMTPSFGPDGVLAGGSLVVAMLTVGRTLQRFESRLRAGELRLRRALDASPDGFAIYTVERDGEGRVTRLVLASINAAGAAGFAGDGTTLVGRDLLDFYPDAATNGLWQDLVAAWVTGRPHRTRIEADGPSWAGVLDGVQVRLDDDLVMSNWRDVTDAVHGESLLARAYEETAAVRATLQTALDATSDGFLVFDLLRQDDVVTGLRVAHANAAAAESCGLGTDEVTGADPRELCSWFADSGLWESALAAATDMTHRSSRLHLDGPDGQWLRSLDTTVAPVGFDQVVLTFRDVTTDEQVRRDHDRLRRRAEHDATHDPLTGLPNRVLFQRHFAEALTSCLPDERVAVVFCDLNAFKQINDTFGHAAGDAVLVATGQRLQALVRRHDHAARLSGDEFALVLRHLPPDWTPGDFVARAGAQLAQPVPFEDDVLTPSASLGVVVADPRGGPPAHRDAAALLAEADLAMYAVKGADGARVPKPR